MTEERRNEFNSSNTQCTWNVRDTKGAKYANTTFFRSSIKNRASLRRSTCKFSMKSSSSFNNKHTQHNQSISLSLTKETRPSNKNTISCIERGIIKKDIQTHANSLNRQGYTGFINAINTIIPPLHNHTILSKQPYQIALKKLMATKLIDILPSKVRYDHSFYLSLDRHYLHADKTHKNITLNDAMNSNMTRSHSSSNFNNTRNAISNNKTIGNSNNSKRITGSFSTDSIFNKLQTTKLIIKQPIIRDDFLKKLLSLNTDHTRNLQLFFKMKSIRWLWKKKAVLLTKIIGSFNSHRWFFNKKEFMPRILFQEFLLLVGLGKDDEFMDLLYLVFAQNKTQVIDIKECIFFFIFFSGYEYERKWRTILEVFEVNNGNNIEKKDKIHLYRLQCYFRTALEKPDFMLVLISFKKYINEDELVDKNEIYNAMINNTLMKSVFRGSYNMMMHVDNKMDEEVESTMNVNSKQQFSVKSYTPALYNQLGRIVDSTEMAMKVRAKMESLNDGIEENTD